MRDGARTMDTVAWLDRLVGFPTVSRDPNMAMIAAIEAYLAGIGARVRVIADETGTKANLFASIGPEGDGGVILSGHTDVVPVDGQPWTGDPFRLRAQDGRYYGRGTTDMKGFLACALRAAGIAAARPLAAPLHLAFSHDEEIGCVGVRRMLDVLAATGPRAALCIVGEPTGMRVATGHKGKLAARAVCCGTEGHSALAPRALNAIHLASDLIQRVRQRQDDLAARGAQDAEYDVPYTTLHVGRIAGGVALNMVPERCVLDFEIRNLAADSARDILAAIAEDAAALVTTARRRFPSADIRMEVVNAYPGLDTAPDSVAGRTVQALTGANGHIKVAFGTEAGLFRERLDVPVVVCGPGDMAQGHTADEFVTGEQLARCDAMMDALLARLAA